VIILGYLRLIKIILDYVDSFSDLKIWGPKIWGTFGRGILLSIFNLEKEFETV
jgi:hypothetical protein